MLKFLQKEYGDLDNHCQMTVLFLSLAVRSGHVCLSLRQSPAEWAAQLDLDIDSDSLPAEPVDRHLLLSSPICSESSGESPLRLIGDLIYLQRYYKYEKSVSLKIARLVTTEPFLIPANRAMKVLNELYPDGDMQGGEPDYQRLATQLAGIKPFLVISGGPGTGKTTTLARTLNFLLQISPVRLRIALAAPTGKAADRMSEAIRGELEGSEADPEILKQIPERAVTLHRLLYAAGRESLLPSAEPSTIPYDLIVIDESSMMDLTLLWRLFRACHPKCRFIFLGDRDQLSPVEAGDLFSEICRNSDNRFSPELGKLLGLSFSVPVKLTGPNQVLNDSIVVLERNYRYGNRSGIGKLSRAIRRGDGSEAAELLKKQPVSDLEHLEFGHSEKDYLFLYREVARRVESSSTCAPARLMKVWSESIILAALRNGPHGTVALNYWIEEKLFRERVIRPVGGWYNGRPIIITRNNYSLGLFNGDLGVCMKGEDGKYRVCFPSSGEELRQFPVHRIGEFEPAYVLTVHKSQGSEYDSVTLMLPPDHVPLLNRKLIYTAVTRSKNRFRLLGDLEIFSKAVERASPRYSAFRDLLLPAIATNGSDQEFQDQIPDRECSKRDGYSDSDHI
ncbi:MAG: exodeoxyribonuclease V subunit alpha [Balneolaceae bacterium]